MQICDEIEAAFRSRGQSMYHGEPVSQAEHALQAADQAVREGAADALVVAALLHDIGHLLDEPEDLGDRGIDGRHEDTGAEWLAAHFGPEIVDPIRMHVDAKRYLCTVDPAYHARLSPASKQSLILQGGPMTPDEADRFESHPSFEAALRLRHWDDAAKIPGLPVPGLDHYLPRVARLASACEEVSR